jgi:maltooligosyltrehalose trehalohydrolase
LAGRFSHEMPFGAALEADGSVRFRLWAPAQNSVSLLLESGAGEKVLPMILRDGGWFQLTTEFARVGTCYRFRLDDGFRVPDPASRFQPEDVHGASEVIDPREHVWRHDSWVGRPWEETVLYEAHLGGFSPGGDFDGARRKLDHLARLGITALELMPLADFAGRRNWGYDGVLPFAPASAYGGPRQLKTLIDEAHGRGIMVFLDVVYNHFGPSGNYLRLYAPSFFTARHKTPWGEAINFEGEDGKAVRDFFIHNALYWLEEYRFDGLRFDAVHAILDDSRPDILEELATTVRQTIDPRRQVHLVLENDDNKARYLARDAAGRPRLYNAQWNDDLHHAAHVILTGEKEGYYADYAEAPVARLARGLAEGFIYQGEGSPFRAGAPRGEPSAHLPPTSFVAFLQNHDQIGNRALGDRLAALAEPAARHALTAILLLSPQIPLLFMGEEWQSRRPFLFFCNFADELARAVREGRRREFARFAEFGDPAARERIPDPNAVATFETSRLDWSEAEHLEKKDELALTERLLALRRRLLVPRLAAMPGGGASHAVAGEALYVRWPLGDGGWLHLAANLSPRPSRSLDWMLGGERLYDAPSRLPLGRPLGILLPWSVGFSLEPGRPSEAGRSAR